MKPFARLTEVFDRGYRDRGQSLSPPDRELFLIQDFILTTIQAMEKYHLSEVADLLGEATDLFRGTELHRRIAALDDFGLGRSSIT